jgi:hypothetical protein
MTRSISVWEKANDTKSGPKLESPNGQPTDPIESFSLELEFDAADDLEKPESHPVAALTGVASRIAALELLLYPKGDNLADGLMTSTQGALGGAVGGAMGLAGLSLNSIANSVVPILLFAWGPGRILPVRMTKFSVEEQAYSPLLYPIRAKASIELEVIPPNSFGNGIGETGKDLAKAAYNFSRKQTTALAVANTANNLESILAMLPF